MRKTTHIWPIEPIEANDNIIISAMIETGQEKSFNLWFRVPIEQKKLLTKMNDPFVISSIFYAMATSDKMVVHGQVSPSLLANLEEFQSVWINWSPKTYRHIEISGTSEKEADDLCSENKAIMAFSGGLDSCFTAYRHKNGNCGRQQRNITTGVLIHGFDIPYKDQKTFDRAADKAIIITKSINMDLISIVTNFRDLAGDWNIVHEAGIAASLALFSKGFSCGVIASSFSYDSFDLNIPWGSNPLTDNLLSSRYFNIFNDGSMYNRTHKLEYLANWPQAMEHMRVCWQGEKLDSNCCKCEKCIRIITSFYALGMKPSKCFPKEITEKQIKNVIVPDKAILFEYQCSLVTAKKRGIDNPQIRALEKCIQKNIRLLNRKKHSIKNFRKTIALRRKFRKLFPYLSIFNRRKQHEQNTYMAAETH